MANIEDYLLWRGDLTFEQSPFNDVDNLILSQLAYVDWKGVIPSAGTKGGISLCSAAEIFFELNNEEELKKVKSFIAEVPFFMRNAAKTKRFKNIWLSEYVEHIDEEAQKQFAAFHAKLGDGSVYIAFKGTDDTIVGWKEDFNMSFIMPVPAQLEAVEYVNRTVRFRSGKVRLGGHSKGGNLAVYAAVKALPGVKKKIIDIYNNDGPGFDKVMINSPEYQQMRPRIKSIVPESSVVGMLLEHDEEYTVVRSENKGIMQHDAMSWQVIGTAFERVKCVSDRSRRLNEALSSWINGLKKEDRAAFVESLFSLITASGAQNLSDLNTDFFRSANAALKAYSQMDKQTKAMLRKMLASLTDEIGKARKNIKI
ncbi:MAG: DUF2974 domain-containing protein [Eubacteriales bacterium]|nr:DUF2974 domain-containing protein [Eubacteriales bacterium]